VDTGTTNDRGGCSRGVSRVIGRLDDLHARERRDGEQRLSDALTRWSLDGNREWLADGVRRGEPFLQLSAATAGTVLAWEIEQLRTDGYAGIGPFWVPVRWLRDPTSYRRVVRLVADHVSSLPETGERVYAAKARAELEPLLACWPFVIVLPTTKAFTIDELIAARAWPVHTLGVVAGPSRADGAVRSPAEFFFHDVDHARFKIREDLLARGFDVPDPYVGGTTFDEARGEHRGVMTAARPHVGAEGWRTAAARAAAVGSWLTAIANEPRRDLAEAARWLLFEMVHEKSLPIDRAVLGGALATDAHVVKLRSKCVSGFYADRGPSPAAVAALDAASSWLRTVVAEVVA